MVRFCFKHVQLSEQGKEKTYSIPSLYFRCWMPTSSITSSFYNRSIRNGQYTRRTVVRRELARTRANSSELARTPRELANGSPTPTVRRTPPDVRRSTPNVRRSSAEFARVRPSSRALRRELANGSPENSFARRNLPTSNGRSPRTGSPRT